MKRIRSLLFATAVLSALVVGAPAWVACDDQDSLGDRVDEAGEEIGDEIDDHTDE